MCGIEVYKSKKWELLSDPFHSPGITTISGLVWMAADIFQSVNEQIGR